MAALTNPRHERFAQELAGGKKAIDAYEIAGFKPSRPHASHLQHKRNVAQRIAEILDERAKMAAQATQIAVEATGADKAWIMARLKENVERAMQAIPVTVAGIPTGEFKYDGAVANRALELLGKEQGMFIERKEVGKPGEFAIMSENELTDSLVDELVRTGIPESTARAMAGASAPAGSTQPHKVH